MQTDTPTPSCRCGHGVGHFMVNAEADYTVLGWIAVTVGISARPVCVKYRCRACDQVFHETREPKAQADQ